MINLVDIILKSNTVSEDQKRIIGGRNFPDKC